MRLTDPQLEARFVAKNPSAYAEEQGDKIDGAQGVRFRCPGGCGRLHTVGFANPVGAAPHPSCSLVDGNTHQPIYWQMSGSGLHDLTLTPSVDIWKYRSKPDGEVERDGSCWHGHITNGEVRR